MVCTTFTFTEEILLDQSSGRVGLDFIRTRPGVPSWGPRGGTLTFRGSGQVRVEVYRPWGALGQGPEGP